jgi:hypothetical protein
MARAEDRILQAFPHSDQAYQITKARWEKSRKEPANNGDAIAWAAYHRGYRAALKTWLIQFTESPELQHVERFYATLYDPDMPDQEGFRAVNDYLAYIADYRPPSINDLLTATWVLVDHNWKPAGS